MLRWMKPELIQVREPTSEGYRPAFGPIDFSARGQRAETGNTCEFQKTN